jgi:hypothetical protein
MFSQNAGNAISETQILKFFRGSMPPDPHKNLAPLALVLPLVSTPQKNFAGFTIVPGPSVNNKGPRSMRAFFD